MTSIKSIEIILILFFVLLILISLSVWLVYYEHNRVKNLIVKQAVKANLIDEIIT